MGLQVYYPADIHNALLAAEQAVSATALAAGSQDDPFTSGYLAGYRAALATLVLAFGLATRAEASRAEWKAIPPAAVSPSPQRR